ncbi:MAG: hypothetical protein SynsKO_22310 [Synoicihabitans sp.]
MLSKLKKTKSKKSESSNKVPAWHLDFRDSDGLPDVKPIRTSFFVNAIAAVIVAAITINFINQELKMYSLRNQVDQLDEQIASDRPASGAAVKKFQQFQAEGKKLKEVAEFVSQPISSSDFLLRLGAILPEQIRIDQIDGRGGVYTLRGSVSGSPDEASGIASGLVETLNTDEVFEPLFDNAALTSLARNPTTGELSFEIVFPVATEE